MGLFNITGVSLVDSAAAAREIGEERLGSLAAGAVAALNPAIREISKTAEEKLSPLVSEASKYGKEKVLPAVGDAANYAKGRLGPLMGAGKYSQGRAGLVIAKIREMVTRNPGTAAMAVGGLVFLFPGIVAVPVLWLFGLGRKGPRAGSTASAYQRRNGNIVRRSGFATLQSAAGGGYGWPAVRWIVRAGLAIMGIYGAGVFLGWLARMVHGHA